MDNQTQQTQTKATQQPNTASNNDEGDKPKATSLTEGAIAAAKRLEEAAERAERAAARLDELEAIKKLSGQTEVSPKEKPKEVDPREYAQSLLKGNALI
jgi:hypothetical protein